MMDILKDMENDGIKPDEQTLYNVTLFLFNLIASNTDTNCHTDAQKIALSALAEFRSIGVEPSLGTYENVLRIYNKSKSKGKTHTIIFDVIEELEKRQNSVGSLNPIIPEDFNFFHQAIFSVSQVNNLKLAYRTHRLLVKEGDNGAALLGNYQNQNHYYK